MKEQRLKKLGEHERNVLKLTTSSNQRARENYHRDQQRRRGRNVCTWCGAEPCGHLWTRPGDEIPDGERCCDRCSHDPVESWQHTHTAWDGDVPYPVCGIRMKEGDVVSMRRDGIIMFLEMQAPAPDGKPGIVPTVAFLGDEGGVGLYTRGEGGVEHTNLWEKKRQLDLMWLPIRMAAAVSYDEERKRNLAALLAQEEADWLQRENERREEEAKKRAATIERKSLQHETVTVLRELEKQGGDDEDEAEAEAAEETEAAAAAPAPKLSKADLKKPRPVKKVGSGRPKRSKRQRDARKRQKRAWAVQEARQRLEVKRLERLGRNNPVTHVKEDE